MKKTTLYLFLATCLLQWFVPLQMIFQQENTLQEGTAFKFKTRPVDPNDPFRGKYIVLNYEEDSFESRQEDNWVPGSTVYVVIENNQEGYAKIAGLEKEEPTEEPHYIRAEIKHIWGQDPVKVIIKYPFERYYMQEHMAPLAEELFRSLNRSNSDKDTIYSLVWVNKGKTALEKVLVNGVPIQDAILQNRQE